MTTKHVRLLCLFALVVVCCVAVGGCSQQDAVPGESAASEAVPAADSDKEAAPVAAPEKPAARTAVLGVGTALRVRTTTTLSTKTATTGEQFVATLEDPLVEGTWVIAPKGARVEGFVVESDKGGRVKGVASISIRLNGLTTADGQRLEISTNTMARQATPARKKDAVKVGIASGVGAAIGAIAGGGKGAAVGAAAGAGAGGGAVLATRGAPAVIAAETVLGFELRAPLSVTEKK